MSIGKILIFAFEKPYKVLRKTLHWHQEKDDSHNMEEARLPCTQKRQPQGTQKRGLSWRRGWGGVLAALT
ncbi:MAG: hypothetical protein H8E47_09085 [Anaerolineales bacterium]|nr:hypothetical protein [Anaerolineales bacterium]